MRAFARTTAALLGVLVLAGCAADINEVKMQHPTILHTQRTEKLYLDVRNASSAQHFPIEAKIRDALAAKGYTMVERAAEADIELRVLVHFCGLEKEAFKSDKVVGGGLLGAGGGVLAAAAGKGNSATMAIGALVGALLGAGGGALAEKASHKETFVGVVEFEIDHKGKPHVRNSVAAKVRERKLTMEQAVAKISGNIANQIAGLF